MDARRRNHLGNEEVGTCIPGLGDNKPRPRKNIYSYDVHIKTNY